MYVVSEITGKKYPSVEACLADEAKVKSRQEEEEKRERQLKALDVAWDEVVKAIENFTALAESIDPNSVSDIKPLISLMKFN